MKPQDNARVVDLSRIDSSTTLLTSLNLPIESLRFQFVSEPSFKEPAGVDQMWRIIWTRFLEDSLQKIAPEQRNNFTIMTPEGQPDALPVLFNTKLNKPRVWAGQSVMATKLLIQPEGATLTLTPINYSVIHALDKIVYQRALEDANGFVPTAGFGIATLVKSADGDLVFTYRPPDTAVYGHRVHPAGGHPRPEHTALSAVAEELEEEFGLKAGEHFDPKSIRALAITVDANYRDAGCQRPELITYVETPLTNAQIVECFEARKKLKSQEPDVSRVVFASEQAVLSGEALREGNILVHRHNSTTLESIPMTPPTTPAMEHYRELAYPTLSLSQAPVRAVTLEKDGASTVPTTPRGVEKDR